jgi:cell division protein FtsB
MPPTEEEQIVAERDSLRTQVAVYKDGVRGLTARIVKLDAQVEALKRELADERAAAVRYRLAVGAERLGYR